ncbi:MAG: glutaredoxin family protein [Bryobacterales bacterium]|nr:glutaredoxin family protein [Bryobacterales bacterium]
MPPLRPRVTLYTRKGCCLCDEAKRALLRARTRKPFDLEEVDIDLDLALRAEYNEEVPVIAVNGRRLFQYEVRIDELLKHL